MELLKAEIARKKAQVQDLLRKDQKCFKRADLSAKHEEEYWKKHKRLKTDDEEDLPNTLAKDKAAEPGTSSNYKSDIEKHVPLRRKEVVYKLRERGEPIRLFGETNDQAYERLRKLEMMAPEINKGFKNDMKTAMDRVDQEYLQEILKAGGESEHSNANDIKLTNAGTTFEELQSYQDKIGKGDHKLDSDVILKYCKLMLDHWAQELNDRDEEEKRDFKGKLASATHTQTLTYLKPLLRKLRKHDLDGDILSCLVDIAKSLLDRNYLQANDAYLEMAIGNAPWPIGVTMVGIHARTGREKISSRNVAHVLNDETQRKYIQALKRLMTKAQKFYPTDPSRSVDFEASIH